MSMKKFIDEMRFLAGLDDSIREQDEQPPAPDEKKGNGDAKSTIKVLSDTDYRDKDAFFKMTQLLKGLAAMADKDETAKKYLSKVSDELTDAAEDILGEGYLGESAIGADALAGFNVGDKIVVNNRYTYKIDGIGKQGANLSGGKGGKAVLVLNLPSKKLVFIKGIGSTHVKSEPLMSLAAA